MTTAYTLRLFDTDLLHFTLEERGIGGLVAQIDWSNEAEKSRFPLDLEPSSAGLIHWLARPVIPKNRTLVAEILQSLGLRPNDPKGIIDVCKGPDLKSTRLASI